MKDMPALEGGLSGVSEGRQYANKFPERARAGYVLRGEFSSQLFRDQVESGLAHLSYRKPGRLTKSTRLLPAKLHQLAGIGQKPIHNGKPLI